MIVSTHGHVTIDGEAPLVVAEAGCMLRSVYELMTEHYSKEFADIMLVKIGKFAVTEDISETGIDEIFGDLKKMMQEKQV